MSKGEYVLLVILAVICAVVGFPVWIYVIVAAMAIAVLVMVFRLLAGLSAGNALAWFVLLLAVFALFIALAAGGGTNNTFDPTIIYTR